MDKGKIKWPGESTITSLVYVMPSHLKVIPKQETMSNNEGSYLKMKEVTVEYEPIEEG